MLLWPETRRTSFSTLSPIRSVSNELKSCSGKTALKHRFNEFFQMLAVPLKVLVPVAYPSEGAHVLYEETFPSACPSASQLYSLFDRRLSLCSNRYSLTNIFNAWKSACDQLRSLHTAAAQREDRFLQGSKQMVL